MPMADRLRDTLLTKVSTTTPFAPRTQELAPLADGAKTRFLLSNPHLITDYGADAAATFVATLRDDQLSADLRHSRIVAQRETLTKLIADLDAVLAATNDTKIITDATFMKDNLSSLLTLSQTLADVEVTDQITTAIDGVTSIIDDPNRVVVMARDPELDPNALNDESQRDTLQRLVIVRHEREKVTRRRMMTWALTAVLVSALIVAWTIGDPDIVQPIVTILCLVIATAYAGLNSRVLQPEVALNPEKFNVFVHRATKYTFGGARELMGLERKSTLTDEVVTNDAVRRWVLTNHEVFNSISTESFTSYDIPVPKTIEKIETRLAKGEDLDIPTKERLAIHKLAQDFQTALVSGETHLQQQRQAVERERRLALKKIADDKKLADLETKHNDVLDTFLSSATDHTSTDHTSTKETDHD